MFSKLRIFLCDVSRGQIAVHQHISHFLWLFFSIKLFFFLYQKHWRCCNFLFQTSLRHTDSNGQTSHADWDQGVRLRERNVMCFGLEVREVGLHCETISLQQNEKQEG